MDSKTFYDKLRQNPLPVVVDLWAPWCGPCKMVKPVLERLGSEYAGRVDVWQINADDSPELMQTLRVYGIPTMILYREGNELARHTGAKPASVLKEMFETLASGETPQPAGISSMDRVIRGGMGIAASGLGIFLHGSWFLLLLGGALFFSAVYDRCPIWRAIKNSFRKLTNQE